MLSSISASYNLFDRRKSVRGLEAGPGAGAGKRRGRDRDVQQAGACKCIAVCTRAACKRTREPHHVAFIHP